jgi:hypothetical protein
MPAPDKRSHRIPHNPTRRKHAITTVNDILTRDDVNGILEHLDRVKPHITDLIVIAIDRRDKVYHWLTTENTLESTAVWMLESTKLDMLNSEDDE